MKDYRLTDYESFEELHTGMAEELSDVLTHTLVESARHGQGIITSVGPCNSDGFRAYIEFTDGVKELHLGIALKSGAIKLPENKLAVYNEFQQRLNEIAAEQKEIDRISLEERRVRREKELEEQKAKLKAELAEKKAAERRMVTLKNLEQLPSNKIAVTFYGALGWLAKNLTRIDVAIPDYCELWFRREFGNAPARVIDSNKKTVGGYSMQWAVSMSGHIKKEAINEIPLELKKYLNEAGVLSNTQFIYTLLTDYGFKIGKEQDIDEIIKYIPNTELENFKNGIS